MHRGEIMAYKNIDQWKNGMIKYAKEKNMDLRDVQQRFILEEFAEKISNSKYRDREPRRQKCTIILASMPHLHASYYTSSTNRLSS